MALKGESIVLGSPTCHLTLTRVVGTIVHLILILANMEHAELGALPLLNANPAKLEQSPNIYYYLSIILIAVIHMV